MNDQSVLSNVMCVRRPAGMFAFHYGLYAAVGLPDLCRGTKEPALFPSVCTARRLIHSSWSQGLCFSL